LLNLIVKHAQLKCTRGHGLEAKKSRGNRTTHPAPSNAMLMAHA